MITFRYRTLMVFAAGFAVALIAVFAFQSWRAEAAEGDPVGGPVAMRLWVGGSGSSVGRTRLG